MKNQVHLIIFFVLVAAFMAYKWSEPLLTLPSFFSNYFEDCLAMPIFFKTALLMIQNIRKKWQNYTISIRDVLILTALISVYFEWIIPEFDQRFTNDPLDFIAYSIGAGFFLLFLNKPLKRTPLLNSNRK